MVWGSRLVKNSTSDSKEEPLLRNTVLEMRWYPLIIIFIPGLLLVILRLLEEFYSLSWVLKSNRRWKSFWNAEPERNLKDHIVYFLSRWGL